LILTDSLIALTSPVTFVHHSNIANETLSNKQKEYGLTQYKLLQDMAVRWNSSYLMLERLYEQIDIINELITEFDIDDCSTFNVDEKKNIFSIIQILSYYFDATLNLSKTNYASISLILPIFNALIGGMAPKKEVNQMSVTLKKILQHYTKFYFKKYIEKNLQIFATASFLDCRTKLFGQVEDSKRKQCTKLAIEFIKSLCSSGPNEIKQLVGPTNEQLSTQPSQARRPLAQITRLQFFDVEQNIT
jgi:hypothetical protein